MKNFFFSGFLFFFGQPRAKNSSVCPTVESNLKNKETARESNKTCTIFFTLPLQNILGTPYKCVATWMLTLMRRWNFRKEMMDKLRKKTSC